MDDMGDDARRQLRVGFDQRAEDYERTRPVCPPLLFDTLMHWARLSAGDRVVEIGCGSGQATLPLAQRGLAVTGVELGAELAAIARRRLTGFSTTTVVTGAFEEWQPETGMFDAVVAFNSLHWIDPQLRYAKPHTLLRPGGALAVAGCRRAQPAAADPFWTEVQADYRVVGYAGDPPPLPEQITPWRFPREAAILFQEVASACFPFELPYRADEYLANLATQSGTRALGMAGSADFLARVRRRLESLGWPSLTVSFVGYLTVGRRM